MKSDRFILEHAQQYGVEAFSDADLLTLVLFGKGNTSKRKQALSRIQQLLTVYGAGEQLLSTDLHTLLAQDFDAPGDPEATRAFAIGQRLGGALEHRCT